MSDPEFIDAAVEMARQVAAELVAEGAGAVVLMGSFARGDATPESDIDLYAIGAGPPYRLERREPFLVSVSWRAVEAIRDGSRSPAEAFGLIPGWRSAVILADREGVAARLRAAAREWTSDSLDRAECDRWVAEQITGYAEEVHKLVNQRHSANWTALAANRSILALRLAIPMAVHHRLLFETENELWNLVNEKIGERWADAQARTFVLAGESLDDTVDAAFELYALACLEVASLLDARQRTVVEHACRLAGIPLEELEMRDR